ncbi:MAG: sugar phosphate isomerase/epimerase [Planctomycetes bacterium]|nr:sugar phosphate isomerase/epimerase [Planctomycetota bacterium]
MKRPTALRIDPPADLSGLEGLCRAAREAGFDGVELPVTMPSERPKSPAMMSAILRTTGLEALNEKVLAVAARCPATDPGPAVEHVSALLRFAAEVGARCLNLTVWPLDRSAGSDGRGSFSDGLNFMYELLRGVRFEAQAAGVPVALEAVVGGAWVSPVELREVIDRANSWALGVCLDVPRISSIGPGADWIETLDYRVWSVRLDLSALSSADRPGESAANGRTLADALHVLDEDRLIIASGKEHPAELRTALDKLIPGC